MRDLKDIIRILKENDVSGYKICLDTDGMITESGATRILKGASKSPRKNTIHLLNKYIDENILNKKMTTPNTRELSEEEKVKTIENLIFHEEELKNNPLFKKWVDRLKMEGKNEALLSFINRKQN